MLKYRQYVKAAFQCVNLEKGAIFMAWTKKELFSFARKCDYFGLRLESGLAKKNSRVVFVLTNYRSPLDPREMIEGVQYSDDILNGNTFPASVVRRAFDYAQQRANELGDDVRIVMEACVKEEYAEPYCDEDEGLFAVATIKPSNPKISDWLFSFLPVVDCCWCMKPATQKMVRYSDDPLSIIEHGCDKHVEDIRGHWA